MRFTSLLCIVLELYKVLMNKTEYIYLFIYRNLEASLG